MREDYIRCIKLNTGVGRKTWCGGDYEPYFTDIEHAAMNGTAEGRLLACPDCIEKINKALTYNSKD